MIRYPDNFEEILDRCLDDIQSGRLSVSECLAAYPEHRARLEELLGLSLRLTAAHELRAPADFRDRALKRFGSTASTTSQYETAQQNVFPNIQAEANPITRRIPANPRASRNTRRPYFSYTLGMVSLIVLILALFTTSIAFAANQSNPGSAFYPIKLALEQAELQLSSTMSGDLRLHLKYSARRLAEVDLLVQGDRVYLIDQALNNYKNHISQLIDLLNSPGTTEQERLEIADQILNSPSFDEANLQGLTQRISPEQRASIIGALEPARAAREQAAQMINKVPEIRDQIREWLISTMIAPSITSLNKDNKLVDDSPIIATPSPATRSEIDPVVIESKEYSEDIPDWYSNTPDWSNLATQYPALYPTLADIATRYPAIRSTQRPYVIPTRIRPNFINPSRQAPTTWPIPPVIPIR